MTKRQQIARNAAWKQALSDGRVVRFGTGTLTSYPTIEMRDAALAKALQGGMPAEVVVVPA